MTFSTWGRAIAVASTATTRYPTAGGCLMGPLLPCASVAAGGGPVSQVLRFALGLLWFGILILAVGGSCWALTGRSSYSRASKSSTNPTPKLAW